jgi:choline dehydrogenase-like flavoprotein
VLPAFRRLETDAEFGDRLSHGDHGPIPITPYLEHDPSEVHAAALRAFDALGYPAVEDQNDPLALGVGRMPMSSRSGKRVTALDAYLPPDWRSPSLAIRPDSPVDRVLQNAGRATGVRLVDGTEISADAVVLAAGTYGSPAILMRSGVAIVTCSQQPRSMRTVRFGEPCRQGDLRASLRHRRVQAFRYADVIRLGPETTHNGPQHRTWE